MRRQTRYFVWSLWLLCASGVPSAMAGQLGAADAVRDLAAVSHVSPIMAPVVDGAGASVAGRATRALERAESTAQPRGRARAASPGGPALRLQAFGAVSWDVFAASKSFEAVLGSSSGVSLGGGARITHRSGLFGQVDISRFKKDGSRVIVSNGQVFPLGIPTTITTTPVDVTLGVEARLNRRRRPRGGPPSGGRGAGGSAQRRVSYYVGGGLGSLGYKEAASFATAGDDASDRFRSYHVMGGVHLPVWNPIGVGFDLQKRWVKDALGSAGVSRAFDETDLGALTFRVRFTVGM